jgi:hypothetical protein
VDLASWAGQAHQLQRVRYSLCFFPSKNDIQEEAGVWVGEFPNKKKIEIALVRKSGPLTVITMKKKTEAKTSCMTAPLQVQYREIFSQQFFHRWTPSYIFPILFANSICEDIEKKHIIQLRLGKR